MKDKQKSETFGDPFGPLKTNGEAEQIPRRRSDVTVESITCRPFPKTRLSKKHKWWDKAGDSFCMIVSYFLGLFHTLCSLFGKTIFEYLYPNPTNSFFIPRKNKKFCTEMRRLMKK